jgi:hypothetical protein
VFRLIRIAFTLGCLAALAWFGTQVRLGELTLYEHIQAIGESKASKDLVEATKQKVSEVSGLGGAVRAKVDKASEKAWAKEDGKPSDAVSDDDRKALRKLLESRQ